MTTLLIVAASLVDPTVTSMLPGPTWAWFGLGAVSLVIVIIAMVIRLVGSTRDSAHGTGSHGRHDGGAR
jgi:bacteriorhodopsin